MDPQNSFPPANNPQGNLPNQDRVPPAPPPPAVPQPANYTPPGTIEPLEPGSLSPQSDNLTQPQAQAFTQQSTPQLPPVEPVAGEATVPTGLPNPQVVVPPAVQKPKSKIGLIIGIAVAVVVVPLLLLIVVLAVQGLQKAKRETTSKNTTSQETTQPTSTTTGSVADAQLTEDIIKYIYISESTKGNASSDITVSSVKPISQTPQQIVEEWTLTIGTTKVVYTVTISPSEGGGSDFGVVKKS